MNLTAFAPNINPLEIRIPDALSSDDVFDTNGLWVPHFWRPNLNAWGKLAFCVRQKFSTERYEQHLQDLAKEAARKPKIQRRHGSRFTTDYAIKWGRRRGWKLIERESYDFRLKRHHDCMFGMDAIMAMPSGGLVGIQGAGRSERKVHRERFDNYGLTGAKGADLANIRNIAIYYCEFERGDFEPVIIERWA